MAYIVMAYTVMARSPCRTAAFASPPGTPPTLHDFPKTKIGLETKKKDRRENLEAKKIQAIRRRAAAIGPMWMP